MITKTTLVAAAFATAIAAQPASVANAGGLNFSFGIDTGDGYISFGTGNPGHGHGHGWGHGPDPYSCGEARQKLKWQFNKVWKVECKGKLFTFKVKNFGPKRTVKFNKWTGNYWFI